MAGDKVEIKGHQFILNDQKAEYDDREFPADAASTLIVVTATGESPHVVQGPDQRQAVLS